MEDLISVIIPVYNAEKTIEGCIKSICDENIEIILVVDGATDKSLEICKNMQKENTNIRVIQQENKGSFEARNKGIENALGKYIMFLVV